MPQIAQLSETITSQVFWLLVFFGITFFVIGRGMVPKIMQTVADRESQIGADLTAAKAARDAADQQEEAWRVREAQNRDAAHAIVTEAKGNAAARSQDVLATAQARFDQEVEAAEIQIDHARREALAELETVATEAAQDIVAKIANINVARPEAHRAVQEALARG